jgi:cytosine/adenosine deaminase-related metal-dependent hydrolase
VVTVDEILGTLPRADVLVRDGRIAGVGPDLAAADAEVIDASDMIVMPGFVDTHYHMWSALGRNFTADGGFGYFPAKNATSKLYSADDFYNSVMLGLVELANAGITTVHNWSHNTRTPRSRRRRVEGAPGLDAARPLRLWAHRPDAARPGS